MGNVDRCEERHRAGKAGSEDALGLVRLVLAITSYAGLGMGWGAESNGASCTFDSNPHSTNFKHGVLVALHCRLYT